jgi:hypothetical protein
MTIREHAEFAIHYGVGVRLENLCTGTSVYFQPGDEEADFTDALAIAEEATPDKPTREILENIWNDYAHVAV